MNSFGVSTQHALREGAHEKTLERRGDCGGRIVSVDRAAASGEARPLNHGGSTTRNSFQETQETIQEQPPPRPPGQTQKGDPPASQILGQKIVTFALECSRMNLAFGPYIGIDYSGAQTPSTSLRGLACCRQGPCPSIP